MTSLLYVGGQLKPYRKAHVYLVTVDLACECGGQFGLVMPRKKGRPMRQPHPGRPWPFQCIYCGLRRTFGPFSEVTFGEVAA